MGAPWVWSLLGIRRSRTSPKPTRPIPLLCLGQAVPLDKESAADDVSSEGSGAVWTTNGLWIQEPPPLTHDACPVPSPTP